jgi:hypothetical protein
MFNFRERFQTAETADLIKMLETPEKYQPEAIAAAKEILAAREFNNPEAWKQSIELLQAEKEKEQEKRASKKNITAPIIDDENNIWLDDKHEIANSRIARNQVICICVVYAILTARSLYYTLIPILFSASGIRENFDSSFLLSYAFDALAIIGIIFFYKKEKSGWIILTALMTTSVTFNCFHLISAINFAFFKNDGDFYFIATLVPPIAYGAMLYQMASHRIMKIYKATRMQFITIVATAAFLYTCFLIGLYLRN